MRPRLLQPLLEQCQFSKVKRLFLCLAEIFEHPWLVELNLTKIDLGKGKRVTAGGGKYYRNYQISSPKIGDHP